MPCLSARCRTASIAIREEGFVNDLSPPCYRTSTWGAVKDMLSRRRRHVLFVLGAALAAGCATKGAMTGAISVPDGPSERVSLQYVGDRTGDSGYLTVTLPGGESFNGP